MNRLLFSVAAGVLSLTLTASVQAHGRSGGVAHGPAHPFAQAGRRHFAHGVGSPRPFARNNFYASRYGHRFNHGYWFTRGNFHWNSRRWFGRYGCYGYWCPNVNSWYYWSAAQNGYYPLNSIASAPPLATDAPISGGPIGPDGAGNAMPPAGP